MISLIKAMFFLIGSFALTGSVFAQYIGPDTAVSFEVVNKTKNNLIVKIEKADDKLFSTTESYDQNAKPNDPNWSTTNVNEPAKLAQGVTLAGNGSYNLGWVAYPFYDRSTDFFTEVKFKIVNEDTKKEDICDITLKLDVLNDLTPPARMLFKEQSSKNKGGKNSKNNSICKFTFPAGKDHPWPTPASDTYTGQAVQIEILAP